MATTRRALLAGAVLLAAGCARTTDEPAAGPSAAADRRTITHKFGETVIEGKPERVVTVGWNDHDFVLALGVVPVGIRAWFDNYDTLPWVTAATGGTKLPTVAADEIDLEAVAAARPEVIVAIYESIDETMYGKLSQIAPTVVQSADHPDGETPWDVQLITTGQALGLADQAEATKAKITDAIEQARTEHPEFAGKVLVEDFGPENGGHYLIGKGDPRRALLDALGFDAQQEKGDLSEENLQLLDRDVLFVVGATKEQMIKSSLFASLAVVREDRTLYTTFESNLAAALSYSGPSALSYALDKLVPELANALNGRPVADLANA